MPQASAQPDFSQTFALLTVDDWQWLIPQGDIHSLEPVFDITAYSEAEVADDALVAPDPVGIITLAGEPWPIYCVAGDFSPLHTIPDTRRICILLRSGEFRWGLVCDQIEVLESEQPRMQPVPACMAKPDSPLHALIRYENNLAYVTTVTHLQNHLQRSGQRQQESTRG
jgi:hypothetical protein